MNQLCTPNLSHWRGSPHACVHVHIIVDMNGFSQNVSIWEHK